MQKRKAILQGKCPGCRKGDLFIFPASNYLKFQIMHSRCECCGVDFQIEPGFYFGAMYISYAFVVGIVIVESLLLFFILHNPGIWTYFIFVLMTVLGLLPWIFRFSRIIFLHLFGGIPFDPNVKLKNC